jgi:peptidoglycan lytic transglycosylase G
MRPRALKLLAVLTMLAGLAGAVAIAVWSQTSAFLAERGPSVAETVVVLPRGAGLDEITARLNAAGVIERPWLFRLAVRLQGQDRALKAGEYAFPAGATPASVINMLARGATVARRLTVAEGLTVAEVYRLLAETDGLTGELPEPPPEGSLLPETYFYALGDARAGLVRRMRRGMRALLDELWPARAEGLPLASPQQAVILASIVDKETAVPDERAKVAAVFLNRLRRGMRLQSDPTVIYGLTGGSGVLDRPLTRSDWQHDSPHNTYRIEGLPPTPIGNPGRAALEAVLHPAEVDYLYFVADGSGGHAFGSTLAEHNRNVANWRRIKHDRQSGPVTPSPIKPDPAG